MNQYKVLAIVPYPGLKEVLNQVQPEFDQLDITAVIENLDQPERVDHAVESGDYDLIISRGGVLRYVASKYSLPCIGFDITLYDIARTIGLLDTYGAKKACIIGAVDVSSCREFIREFFHREIPVFDVETFDETEIIVRKAAEEGYEVIIGDNAAWRAAKETGMPAILLMNGEESVKSALKTAVETLRIIELEKTRSDVMQHLLSDSRTLWCVTDGVGNEIYSNFRTDKTRLLAAAKDALKTAPGSLQAEATLHWADRSWKCREEHTLIGHGLSVTILSVKEEDTWKEELFPAVSIYSDGYSDDYTSVLMNGKNEECRAVSEQVKYLADLEDPVLIIGDPGTGCGGVAYEIHKRSRRKKGMFLEVDCSLLDMDSAKRFFNQNNELLSESEDGTVFLRRIEKLQTDIQAVIMKYFTRANRQKYRIISSSIFGSGYMANSGAVSAKFIQLACEYELRIPSLARQKDNIAALTGLYISSYNMTCGRKVTGIEEEGRKLLAEYAWPGNIEQFQTVLKNALANIGNNYKATMVKSEWIKHALDDSRRDYAGRAGSRDNMISIEGTLDEIEMNVINRVLEECEMNQTKAAERLGVSRSTLYRKLLL